MNRRLALPAALIAASLALAGCTGQADTISKSYREGAGQNYVSGDGSVKTIVAADREAAIDFGGTTDEGTEVDSSELKDKVVVLNFWYASCPPCRAEAPDLVELTSEFSGEDVEFLGVNVSDDAPTARAFATKYGIPYPSLLDAAENEVQLAFAGQVPPNAVPTTLVLDREGRVAARFSGLITSPSTVSSVITDALAEGS